MRLLWLVPALVGCASATMDLPPDHPGRPDAPAAPAPEPSRVLLEDPAAPEPEAGEEEGAREHPHHHQGGGG